MKIISPFVDHRDGKRYGPGEWDKIESPLEDAEIERLKGAGCLEDGEDDGSPSGKREGSIPASRTEMRTEAGERAHRAADKAAVNRLQQPVARDVKPGAKPTLTMPANDLAGRSKPMPEEPGK